MEIAFVFALLAVALVVIALELVAIDVVALALLVAVVAAGILPPEVALSGFSSEVVIILASVFVIAGTMTRAELAEAIAEVLLRAARRGERSGLAIVMAVSAMLSMVLSNTSTASLSFEWNTTLSSAPSITRKLLNSWMPPSCRWPLRR